MKKSRIFCQVFRISAFVASASRFIASQSLRKWSAIEPCRPGAGSEAALALTDDDGVLLPSGLAGLGDELGRPWGFADVSWSEADEDAGATATGALDRGATAMGVVDGCAAAPAPLGAGATAVDPPDGAAAFDPSDGGAAAAGPPGGAATVDWGSVGTARTSEAVEPARGVVSVRVDVVSMRAGALARAVGAESWRDGAGRVVDAAEDTLEAGSGSAERRAGDGGGGTAIVRCSICLIPVSARVASPPA